ncbi:MAG TPA: hypothetical protein PK954_22465 [Anaerolineales bacterium]|nr:hypothetical protein [Anaerolineales bacterium]
MATIPLPPKAIDSYRPNLAGRHAAGRTWETIFLAATMVGILGLVLLMFNIVNNAFGIVAYADENDYSLFSPVPVEQLADSDLIVLLTNELSTGAINKLLDCLNLRLPAAPDRNCSRWFTSASSSAKSWPARPSTRRSSRAPTSRPRRSPKTKPRSSCFVRGSRRSS